MQESLQKAMEPLLSQKSKAWSFHWIRSFPWCTSFSGRRGFSRHTSCCHCTAQCHSLAIVHRGQPTQHYTDIPEFKFGIQHLRGIWSKCIPGWLVHHQQWWFWLWICFRWCLVHTRYRPRWWFSWAWPWWADLWYQGGSMSGIAHTRKTPPWQGTSISSMGNSKLSWYHKSGVCPSPYDNGCHQSAPWHVQKWCNENGWSWLSFITSNAQDSWCSWLCSGM